METEDIKKKQILTLKSIVTKKNSMNELNNRSERAEGRIIHLKKEQQKLAQQKENRLEKKNKLSLWDK